ncbi:MAG: DNA primase [Bacteroidales bacterium]|nr:DNA primase [Bacteroidales bacterium]
MIPRETVQKILDTAQVEEVVADFVSLKKRGAEWWGCCPFHNEKTPSFHVVPARGIYYCFGCHKGGSAVGFVMDHEHMSYPDALRYLAKKYNIEVVEEEQSAEELAARQRNESLYLVSEFAEEFFKEQLSKGEGKAVGLNYFHSRGLEDATIGKYGLGWAPSDRHAFTDAAKAKGYKDEYLLETGLCAKYDDKPDIHDRFVERVTFPIHSISGRIIGFGARTLKSKEEGKPYAKYVNSKESAIYVKNQSLYGIWFAKGEMAKKDKCFLVEGYLDVLSMHQLGITNVVASSGTALTDGQIRLIGRFTKNVTIMYDGDEAGVKAALRGIDMFLRQGMNVKVVLIPDGDDPDSYARKHTLEEVEDFISGNEQDFVDFQSSLLLRDTENDPLRRADAINEIADTVAQISDGVKRETYIDFLSRKFDIRRTVLEDRVGLTRTKLLTQTGQQSEPDRVHPRPTAAEYGLGSTAAPAITQDSERSDAGSLRGTPLSPPRGQGGLTFSSSDDLSSLEENPIMAKAERDLLSFILTYGTTRLEFQSDSEFYTEDEEDVQTVFEFIGQAIEADGTVFANKAYQDTYDAYSEEYYNGYSQNDIVRHLMDGEDRTVAFVAAQLSTEERYDLSIKNLRDAMMSKGSWLTKFVPKSILVFQVCRLEDKEHSLKEELREAQDIGDQNREMEILKSLVNLRKAIKTVKVRLGREK